MKKLFVVSDVHSFYNEMIRALDDKGFDVNNNNHIFVSCGDLLDRGPDAVKCLNFVNNLPDDRKILIRGNHEDLMQEAIYKGFFQSHDYHNHTNETAYQITGIHPENENYIMADKCALTEMKFNNEWDKYRNSLVNYYETKDYIFVHGWIPVEYETVNYKSTMDSFLRAYNKPIYDKNWREDYADWGGARWLNGMSMWKLGVREKDKTIICGHWHSSYGHCRLHNEGVEFSKDINSEIRSIHTPFYDNGIIAIDACTAYSGFVNCLKLEVEDE